MEDITYGRVVVLHKLMAPRVRYVRISPLAVVESVHKSSVIWIFCHLGKEGVDPLGWV